MTQKKSGARKAASGKKSASLTTAVPKAKLPRPRKAGAARAPAGPPTADPVAALRESETLLRAITDHSEDMIFVKDRELRFRFMNPAGCRLSGLTPAQLTGHTDAELEPNPAQAAAYRAVDQRVMESRQTVTQEEAFMTAGREHRILLTAKTPWFDAQGNVVGIIGISRDITERHQVEHALLASEERYRLLADNAEDFVFLHDTEGNRLYVSPSFYRRTGWTPEEVQAIDWRTRVHPDDLPLVEHTRAANLAGETTTLDHRLRCRDGSWLWVEARCKPLRDATGKVWRLVLWSRDITARKQANAALRASEERLRLALDATGLGMSEFDLGTGRTHWNIVEFELLGLKPGAVTPSPETFFRHVHPDDLSALQAQWEAAKRTGQFDAEFRIVRADGQERWLAGKGRFASVSQTGGAPPTTRAAPPHPSRNCPTGSLKSSNCWAAARPRRRWPPRCT